MTTTNSLVTVLIAAAAGIYAAAFVCSLSRRRQIAIPLFITGFGVNTAVLVLNWVICGHPPFGNMYHVQIFLSMCFFPLYLVMSRRFGLNWVLPYFAFAALIPLIGTFLMERDLLWQRVPALQSPWFMPHVISYMISYALAGVAFALTAVGIWQRRGGGLEKHPFAEASYQILRLAFPFMTFGMLSGALWAEEAWGVYWSWDPKETWSLITWTLYIVYFHCRLHRDLKRYATPAQLAAFAALIVTFLLVNLLPKLSSALHSYA